MIENFALVYLLLVILMSFVWVLYRVLDNPSIVDVSWSLGLMTAGLTYLSRDFNNQRHIVVSMLLMAWSLRLASHLWFTRVRHGHVDKRYTDLSKHWKINIGLGFFINFQFQALLIFIISSPFYFISHSNQNLLTGLDYLGMFLVIIGTIGESIADWQLRLFKKQASSGVCDKGLWAYSRHPNYFFDWIVWCGFSVFSLADPLGYLCIVSPGLLYFIFTQVTGPITEAGSIQSRGTAFINYQKQTPMFFPKFKR